MVFSMLKYCGIKSILVEVAAVLLLNLDLSVVLSKPVD
jgi:hypothetical protein